MTRPLNLAMSADLPNPGDCLSVEHLPIPVLLTRDRDGTAHAFFNVCRHRGAQLIQGRASGYNATTSSFISAEQLQHFPQPSNLARPVSA